MPANCLSVFDHFVGLALKGLKTLEELPWKFWLPGNIYLFKDKNRKRSGYAHKVNNSIAAIVNFTCFTRFSFVSFVDFEQVNFCWVTFLLTLGWNFPLRRGYILIDKYFSCFYYNWCHKSNSWGDCWLRRL